MERKAKKIFRISLLYVFRITYTYIGKEKTGENTCCLFDMLLEERHVVCIIIIKKKKNRKRLYEIAV